MRQFVSIQGHSSLNPPGGATGPGVFVFRSNTGNFERHQFAISPELNINGVIHFSPAWRAMAGYSIIYWSNTVLAGNQIDTQIDPTQTIAQPRFHFQRTDFLVQGINLGAEYRW